MARRCRRVRVRGGRRAQAASASATPRPGRLPPDAAHAVTRRCAARAGAPAERAPAAPRHRRLDDPDHRLVPEGSGSAARACGCAATPTSPPASPSRRCSTGRRRPAARPPGSPDVVVMFIGANDGFPMARRDCCGAAWVAEYARRARRDDAHVRAAGAARASLAAPARRPRRLLPADLPRRQRGACAARRAGARRRRADRPRWRSSRPAGATATRCVVGGKVVRVRQGDGVHLNTSRRLARGQHHHPDAAPRADPALTESGRRHAPPPEPPSTGAGFDLRLVAGQRPAHGPSLSSRVKPRAPEAVRWRPSQVQAVPALRAPSRAP